MDQIDQSATEVEQTIEAEPAETADTGMPDDSEFSGGEPDEGEPESDEDEVELDGEKFRLPKKVREAVLRQEDYTKKTQSLAEQRREFAEHQSRLQQEQQVFAEHAQLQKQNIQAYAQLHNVDRQLQEYQGVNWQQLDPQVAQQHWMNFQQLKEQRQGLAQGISQAEQHQSLQARHIAATRLEQAQRELAREIKDWSPETQRQLRDYGKSIGFTDHQLNSVESPQAIKLLHKAMLYDKHVASATKKPAPTVQATPIKTVRSGSGSTTSPDNMSMEQWAAYDRKRQAAKRKP